MTDPDELRRRIREGIRRARADDHCPRCGLKVNPLLHVGYPWLCPATPPLGGWPEPHKDDL